MRNFKVLEKLIRVVSGKSNGERNYHKVPKREVKSTNLMGLISAKRARNY
jgi:hypothetical protein